MALNYITALVQNDVKTTKTSVINDMKPPHEYSLQWR